VTSPWPAELWRIAGLAAAAFILGAWTGHTTLWLLLAASAYCGQLLVQVYRLERWMRHGPANATPRLSGAAFEIARLIERQQSLGRERQRRLSAVIDRFQEATTAMPDGTVVMNARGEILWFNDAAARLLGLRAGKDVGVLVENLVRQPRFVQYLNASNFTEPVEFPSPLDTTRRLQVHVTVYGDGQRLMLVRDVTRIYRLEQMRRDFVANVSHELRTPLTVISGYLETMHDDRDGQLPQAWGPLLAAMREQASRMQQIVDDLLLLARLEAEDNQPRREPVSVPSLLAAIVEDARQLRADLNQTITLDARADLWLHGSEAELRSAFSNLVLNAVRYTPANGAIKVQWHGDAMGATLDVIDNGAGIAAHHIPRLTERFYRVDVGRSRDAGGTGLGLAIVKHVLSRHQAHLEIESRLGEGSRFSCQFPATVVLLAGKPAA